MVAHRASGIVMVLVEVDSVGSPADVEVGTDAAGIVAFSGDGHGAGAGTAVVAPREGVVGIYIE